jgi:hypothetical protein
MVTAAKQFEVLDSIVVDISVNVMNVETFRDWSTLSTPDFSMEEQSGLVVASPRFLVPRLSVPLDTGVTHTR